MDDRVPEHRDSHASSSECSGCRLCEKCSYAHRQAEEQPCKRSKKNGDKSAEAMLKQSVHYYRMVRLVVNVYSSNTRQLCCVFQDMEPPKSSSMFAEELKHTETNPMCSIH